MNQSGEFCKLMVFIGAKITNIVQNTKGIRIFYP